MATLVSPANYPEGLRQKEQAALEVLRAARGEKPMPRVTKAAAALVGAGEPAAAAGPQVGLALSGGGIRSATFCLGVLQALAQQKLIRRIEILSTVSGGGYIGGFLGSLFARPGGAADARRIDEVEATLADHRSTPINWLRENGRYLAPGGAGDYLYALATQVRNWVAVQYVFALTFLVLLLIAANVRMQLWHRSPTWWRIEDAFFPWYNGAIWWSAWWMLPALWFAFALAPLGWAYWLTQTRAAPGQCRCNLPFWASLLVIIGAGGAVWFADAPHIADGTIASTLLPPWHWSAELLATAVTVAGVLAIVIYVVGVMSARPDCNEERDTLAREKLTQWLTGALGLWIAFALAALVDTLGQTLYLWTVDAALRSTHVVTVGGAAAALIALLRRVLPWAKEAGSTKLRVPLKFLALAAGLAFFLALLATWSAATHAILWQGERPEAVWCMPPPINLLERCTLASFGPHVPPPWWPVAIAFVAVGVLAALTGRTLSFLNLSTLEQFYAKRLTRAYLGASNQTRLRDANNALLSVRMPAAEDDIAWRDYHPEANGGPIHIVNVTLNETVSGKSNLEQRDRKGLPMAVGPASVSVGARHHLYWSADNQPEGSGTAVAREGYAIFPAGGTIQTEPLTLGHWVAISGAAVSTGMGHGTSLGYSLLLALANVRLGHWWDSGVDPARRKDFRVKLGATSALSEAIAAAAPTLAYLLDELFARFHGPARRHWYLTDGGHFENTAVYELIRRRLPFIVVCDDGQDAQYHLGDLGNLVRSVRTDFGADIRFLTALELDAKLGAGSELRRIVGSLEDVQPQSVPANSDARGLSRAHAALAHVRYAPLDANANPDANAPAALEGWMLVIKPTLIGDEPLDVLNYARENADFPQQSTGNQFFDEAQWESYRKLGEHIATALFSPATLPGRWSPREAMRA